MDIEVLIQAFKEGHWWVAGMIAGPAAVLTCYYCNTQALIPNLYQSSASGPLQWYIVPLLHLLSNQDIKDRNMMGKT